MTLTARLVRLARASAAEPDVDALRARLLHNLAAALGRNDEAARISAALADESGPGQSAFRLATAMHARTQDDFHPPGRVHVGTVVIPAVLAVGDGDPLPALSAGYEVLAAIAETYSGTAQRRGYRPTGMFGPIGAAAAAGIALDLDDDQLASALALASAMSAGTNQSWIDGTDEWLVEVAAAARAGVDSARLARGGVRGAPRALDGPAGWAPAFFDDDGQALLTTLEAGASRTAAVAVKLYPVSGIAQVPVHLAAGLGGDTAHSPLERLEVRMNPRELSYPGSRNRGPFTGRSDALMSIVRCVAIAYIHGTVPYRTLLDSPDEDESTVLDIIDLVPDPDADETEVTLHAELDGEAWERHGHGDDLLYPTWSDAKSEADGIARRSEAAEDAVADLAAAIASGVDVATIASTLGVSS